MRSPLTAPAVLLSALVAVPLAACSGPAAPGGTSAGPEESTRAPAPAGIVLDATCTGPGGITVAHPADWSVNPGDVVPACTRFAPEEFEVRPYSDVRVAAVVLAVEDLPLAVLAVAGPDEVARTDVVVGGRPAVRQVLVTGPGLHPEGTSITRYLVDLGRERTLVADAVRPPGRGTGETEAVLDAMMAELQIGGSASR
ncbi:hypothetical protein [Trujillonella humicola]|uniref:hypothetical protein n=1 Tax=Trujillonella humicola TaxID=3383699 RepID=UPI00390665FB